jgi:DNA-binding response OmpR family regulator
MLRVLLAEDDAFLADALAKALRDYQVDIVFDGEMALAQVSKELYHVLLLDVMMPKLTGIQVCSYLRSQGNSLPIVLMTARDQSTDKVQGLDAGADDYLVKPVDIPELQARIRALLRRQKIEVSSILTWGSLTLDPASHEVFYHQNPIRLTPSEFALLELFLKTGRRVLSCQAMIDLIWPVAEAPTEEAIRTHIKTLRQKLKAAGSPDLIETVFGIGYRLK